MILKRSIYFFILIALISCNTNYSLENSIDILENNPHIPSLDKMKRTYHSTPMQSAYMPISCKEGTYILNNYKAHTNDQNFFTYFLNRYILIDGKRIPFLITYAIIEEKLDATLYFIYFDAENGHLVIFFSPTPVKFPYDPKNPIDIEKWPNEVVLLLALVDDIRFKDDTFLNVLNE